MLTVILGLSGALVYGVADFLGGFASRRARALTVTAVAATVGLVPLVAVIPLFGAHFGSRALLWGAVAGASGSVGIILLYSALAIGPMSVLSPITSVFAALLPVAVAVIGGAHLPPLAIGAIVVAFTAIILVASVKDTSGARLTLRGLLLAAVAGCGFGGIVLAYDAAGSQGGIAPLIVARVLQAVVMWIALALLAARAARRGALDADSAATGVRGDSGLRTGAGVGARVAAEIAPLRGVALVVILCGVFDAGANAFIQAALHSGTSATTLPTVSVLNALYPIGTVVLAAIVLRERLTVVQIVGLVLAFAASVTLALT
ncbi:hypothetical protein AX769_15840 [Frondihabitans sp. PAMC 28766]|uniref:EamA family transporter n=1 Tax=Frondihabitans sp. PAMC 28766 TaxID=1795630 RepID=UPI00078D9B31|nr:EamA family transporter [Frondihabitans sp. PAMC 28766]AMM21332.1 hypothetical protein AX769_15840 [Frondihabitans sp. PAMC 28766]